MTERRVHKDLRSIYGAGQKSTLKNIKKIYYGKNQNMTINQGVRKSLIDFPNIGNVQHFNSNNKISSPNDVKSKYPDHNVHEISDLILENINKNK